MTDTTSGSGTSPSVYVPRRFDRPYDAAAPAYREKGWDNPLPIGLTALVKDGKPLLGKDGSQAYRWLPGQKQSPPGKYTGGPGLSVDTETMNAWRAHRFKGACNIGLRLNGVVGIDIDGADGAAIVESYGGLPATFSSTSRGTGQPRRILFFRTPAGLDVHGAEWALRERHGVPGPDGKKTLGLDILHRGYRYAVVYPSIHPGGGLYTWYDHDGAPCPVPAVAELPMLPERWRDLMRELVAEHGNRIVRAGIRPGERRAGCEYGDEDPIPPQVAGRMMLTALRNIASAPTSTERPGAHYNDALSIRSLYLFRFAPEFASEDEIQEAIEEALTEKFGAPDGNDLASVRSARSAVGKQGYGAFRR